MSHSRFHLIEACTRTCTAQSLRQAYDYWQEQPGNCPKLDQVPVTYFGRKSQFKLEQRRSRGIAKVKVPSSSDKFSVSTSKFWLAESYDRTDKGTDRGTRQSARKKPNPPSELSGPWKKVTQLQVYPRGCEDASSL